MIGHGGSRAGSYLADPTSPIPSHCASIVATSTLRVHTGGLHTEVILRTGLTEFFLYIFPRFDRTVLKRTDALVTCCVRSTQGRQPFCSVTRVRFLHALCVYVKVKVNMEVTVCWVTRLLRRKSR